MTLLGLLALSVLPGCDLEWPGTTGDTEYETRFADSWTLSCDCAGTEIGASYVSDRRVAETSICAEAEPDLFSAQLACGGLAYRLRASHPSRTYECAYVNPPAPRRDAVGTCPYRVRVDGSSSSPLTSTEALSNPVAIGWPNPMADFEGVLTSSDALLSVNYLRWRDARPTLTGGIFFSGGRCEGSTCEIVLDGLDLEADDFRISRPWPARDTQIREGNVRSYGRWVGLRNPDGSVEFADAQLAITGRIDGSMERMIVTAPEPIRGRFGRDHDGRQFFLLEGSLRGSDVRLSLSAHFTIVGGTPTATVTTSTSCTSSSCVHTHSAASSRTFDGRSVSRYRWYDSRGSVVSVGSSFRGRSTTLYPLTVRVEDRDGRFDTAQVRRPFSLIPDRRFTIPLR